MRTCQNQPCCPPTETLCRAALTHASRCAAPHRHGVCCPPRGALPVVAGTVQTVHDVLPPALSPRELGMAAVSPAADGHVHGKPNEHVTFDKARPCGAKACCMSYVAPCAVCCVLHLTPKLRLAAAGNSAELDPGGAVLARTSFDRVSILRPLGPSLLSYIDSDSPE